MKIVNVKCGPISGFPSPAQDYAKDTLSLDQLIIRHPSATFFARATGDSMTDFGINNEDILVIDRAENVQNGDVVVCRVNDEFICKSIDTKNRLLIGNRNLSPIEIDQAEAFSVEGVCISVVKLFRKRFPYSE